MPDQKEETGTVLAISPGAAGRRRTVVAKTRTKTTVLLVDDESFFLEVLSDLFNHREYSIVTAASGREGLEQARRHRPDVILLDLHMPSPDGIETCKLLKADETTREIPVVILTAEESLELNQMAFGAGAQATMLKSMSLDRLINFVDVILQTRTVPDPRILPEG
jgi:CheY-like chemotaxis protein